MSLSRILNNDSAPSLPPSYQPQADIPSELPDDDEPPGSKKRRKGHEDDFD